MAETETPTAQGVVEVPVDQGKPDGVYSETVGIGSAEPVKEDAPPAKVEEKRENEPVQDEPPAATEPADAKMSARFAALARKEKQLRERELAAKGPTERLAQIEKVLAAKDQDPLAVLDALGMSYRGITDYILTNSKEETPEQQAATVENERIAALEAKLTSYEEKLKAEEDKLRVEKLSSRELQFRGEIKTLLDGKPDDFEIIRSRGKADVVFDTMQEYYALHGTIPDMEKTAREIEAHLEQEAREMMKLKKFAKGNGSVTLSSKTQAESQVFPKRAIVDPEESKREAARLLRWTD